MFAVALTVAQKYLLQRLRLTKYKEISEKKLVTEIRTEHKKRKPVVQNLECIDWSKKFPLGLRYHVCDLVGRGIVTRVIAPSLSVSAAGNFDGILRSNM